MKSEKSAQKEVIRSDPDDGREECQSCNRWFNPEALEKHSKVCKKVFGSKRKEFNSINQRFIENDQKIEHLTTIKKKKGTNEKSDPSWKQESENFRAILKAARTGEVAKIVQKDTRTPCPYCDRKFNQNAAERHINFCKTKAKDQKNQSLKSNKKQELLSKKKVLSQYGRVTK